MFNDSSFYNTQCTHTDNDEYDNNDNHIWQNTKQSLYE